MILNRYIAPEQVPIQYGGLSREGEQEFTTSDPVTEVTIKPASKHAIEFAISEVSWCIFAVQFSLSVAVYIQFMIEMVEYADMPFGLGSSSCGLGC